ncbi:hypothetical protein DFS34DRAFT_590621 [Phlyctochytrium arcticum]|nr:hypothetical protein DFS34DRAFT_590621 [Phlyctochytrium arcticum]
MYRQLGVAIFEAWLKSFVGKEPSGLVDYHDRRVGCSCEDCSQLDAFLTANDEQECRFRAIKKRRQHLEDRLKSFGSDCVLATNKSGSPQTLVVKTLDKGTAAKTVWTDKFTAAGTLISQFDQALLNELLGEEYDRLVNMRDLRYTHAPTQDAEADTSPRGVKRKEL